MRPAQRNLFQSQGPYLRFVVHLHQATRLHYDLRLEVNGKLLSWALPKGPSTDPKTRRLSILQKDHSLNCLTVEGCISPGKYGAGPILLWDRGEYEPGGSEELSHEQRIQEAMRRGFLRLRLYGEKLAGGWSIKRIKDQDWLLEKTDDEFASSADILQFNRSVLSGRTLQDLIDPNPQIAACRYVLRVEIEGFYAALFSDQKPLIVVHEGVALDANMSAKRRGVKAGMTVRDASNIVPDIQVRHWKAEDYEEQQRAWLDECVQFCDAIEPDQQNSAFLDLSQHPEPTDIADRAIAAIHKTTGLPVRFGAGPSKWVAVLAAEHGEWQRAVKAPREFLAPLSIQELRAVLPGSRDRLQFLGYRTIGDVAALDPGVLYRQFGQEAITICQAATGTLSDPVIGRYPPNTISARLLFPDPIESLEALDANFGHLSQRLGGYLTRKGLEGSKLELSREDEEHGWSTRIRQFAKPMRCPATVLTGIRAVSNEAPPEASITGMRVRMNDLRRVKSYQPVFLGRASSDDQAIQLGRALTQVQTTFGETSILRASDMPMDRRVKVLKEWQSALGWR